MRFATAPKSTFPLTSRLAEAARLGRSREGLRGRAGQSNVLGAAATAGLALSGGGVRRVVALGNSGAADMSARPNVKTKRKTHGAVSAIVVVGFGLDVGFCGLDWTGLERCSVE